MSEHDTLSPAASTSASLAAGSNAAEGSSLATPSTGAGNPLSFEEMKSLEVLAYLFYQSNHLESALRTVTVLLHLQPDHVWAQGLRILCHNGLEHYDKVLELTSDLSAWLQPEVTPAESAQDHTLSVPSAALRVQGKALQLVRARALQKLGHSAEAQALVAQLTCAEIPSQATTGAAATSPLPVQSSGATDHKVNKEQER